MDKEIAELRVKLATEERMRDDQKLDIMKLQRRQASLQKEIAIK